jgi:hypothetical protein
MSVTVITPLQPGRYVVRGGPRGDTIIQRVMRPIRAGESPAIDRGRRVIRNTARDSWPILAAFRVRPGARVTHYGALDAIARVWSFGGTS